MSLRARLVLIVAGLTAFGLFLALGASYGALRDWKSDEDDEMLTRTGHHIETLLHDSDVTLADAVDPGTSTVWRQIAADGDAPSFFQLRGPGGEVVASVALGTSPNLSTLLPREFWPAETTTDNPDGQRFAEPGAGWLIRSSWVEHNILLVGTHTDRSDELMSRTRNVAVVTGVIALFAVAFLSLWAVRRGLQPLRAIAATAAEIGSGNLSRRVAPAKSGTELGVLSRALNAMLAQIESAFAERERSEQRLRAFVADASHELRTPLASIRGYAELFHRGASTRPNDLAKVMGRIESEAQRMGLLVDELLLLARLDQGRSLEIEPVELTALAAAAVADAQAADSQRNFQQSDDGPIWVVGDDARLKQVLTNLLANVSAHTPPGTTAAVSIRVQEGWATIKVSDDGPGIPQKQVGRVFDRFYRVDQSRGRGGSGLGLAIVAAIAEAHGGVVTVASRAGGTTFRVEIPVSGARLTEMT